MNLKDLINWHKEMEKAVEDKKKRMIFNDS